MPPKIVAFAGSLRKDSWNKKLIQVLAEGARQGGAEVTVIDLKDYPLPPYDGDLEAAQGLPENAKRLKELFIGAHGLLVSSPEYNGGIPGVLKNVVDWVSRPVKDQPQPFAEKAVGIAAATPGALGGVRMLPQLRNLFSTLGAHVHPLQLGLGKANEAFGDDGKLKDAKQQAQYAGLGEKVAKLAARLTA